jgi:hypothetical protein
VRVPDSPQALFEDFLPRCLDEWPSPRLNVSAPLVVRVVGAGQWSLSLSEGKLIAVSGPSSGAVLQLSLGVADFGALVVEPLSRLLASIQDAESRTLPRSGALGSSLGLVAKVAGWDEETISLVRQQSGSVLLKATDGTRVRCLALTPGDQPYSLEVGTCTVSCSMADLLDIQEGRTGALDVFYAGRVKIAGDAQIALALAGLFA